MLQRRWSSGAESKLFAVYDRPFWREEGLSGQAVSDLPVAKYVIDNSPPDAGVGILLTFLGTTGSSRGPDTILDDPAARAPPSSTISPCCSGRRRQAPPHTSRRTGHTSGGSAAASVRAPRAH